MTRKLALVLLALSFPLCGVFTSRAAADPIRLADAFLIESTGEWFCPEPSEQPRTTVKCSGERGSRSFAKALLKRNGLAGTYIRVAKSRNDCNEPEDCTGIGVPSAPTDTPCVENDERQFCVLTALKKKGVRLGIVLGAAKKEVVEGPNPPRDVADIAWHACQIKMRDNSGPNQSGLYSFMFLDMASRQRPTKRLKRLVGMIQRGRIIDRAGRTKRCSAGGWPRLITNDTNRDISREALATGAWGHAKRLEIVSGGHAAKADRAASLTANDEKFVRVVKGLKARAVLRLEVTPDTSDFSLLKSARQCALLGYWAGQQDRLNYSLIFPLYVHGAGPGEQGEPPGGRHPYDSLAERTFPRQLALITRNDRDSAPCPAQQGPTANLPAPLLSPVAPGPTAPPPPPPAAVRAPDVSEQEPTNVMCNRARLHGWVNPHGNAATYHFEYWLRNHPEAPRQVGNGVTGAGLDRVSVTALAEGLQRDTGYTGRLIASNAGGRTVSGIFSFTTANRC